jgi:hypothetical protein
MGPEPPSFPLEPTYQEQVTKAVIERKGNWSKYAAHLLFVSKETAFLQLKPLFIAVSQAHFRDAMSNLRY